MPQNATVGPVGGSDGAIGEREEPAGFRRQLKPGRVFSLPVRGAGEANQPFLRTPAAESGVPLRFPPQSKKWGCGVSRASFNCGWSATPGGRIVTVQVAASERGRLVRVFRTLETRRRGVRAPMRRRSHGGGKNAPTPVGGYNLSADHAVRYASGGAGRDLPPESFQRSNAQRMAALIFSSAGRSKRPRRSRNSWCWYAAMA